VHALVVVLYPGFPPHVCLAAMEEACEDFTCDTVPLSHHWKLQ